MTDHWLYDRGLESGGKESGEDALAYATIPTDYVSRVEALRCAIEWAREATVTRDQTIQRALDFHAFLMGRTQKEPVNTDE